MIRDQAIQGTNVHLCKFEIYANQANLLRRIGFSPGMRNSYICWFYANLFILIGWFGPGMLTNLMGI